MCSCPLHPILLKLDREETTSITFLDFKFFELWKKATRSIIYKCFTPEFQCFYVFDVFPLSFES